ncbi:MAG: hypothetical protein V7711_19035 [Pseudomonadales bacterium]
MIKTSRYFCAALLLTCVGAMAQQTKPLEMEPLFQFNPTSADDLASQQREFSTLDLTTVLDASTSVLQDMGYSVSGGDRQLGLLHAYKVADVPKPGLDHTLAEAGLVTVTVLASLLIGQDVVMDLPEQVSQHIYVSLLVSPVPREQPRATRVRLSLDRDMLYDNGRVIADHTELLLINQEFFEKLNKSVFLEEAQL